MKEYFYMFSRGDYSDYGVVGLFKSKQDLTREWFGQYLKDKLIEKFPEGKEFFNQFPPDIGYIDTYSTNHEFYIYATQDEEPEEEGRHKDEGYYKELDSWYKRKDDYIRRVDFHTDVTQYAIEGGILEAVHYEEIWSGS